MIALDRRAMLKLGLSAGGVLTLGGCGAQPDSSVLTVSLLGSYLRPVYERIVTGFERRQPGVSVRLVSAPDNWQDQMQGTLLDSISGRLADVTEQALNLFSTLVHRQLVHPLDGRIAQARGGGLALPDDRVLDLGRFQGTRWGIPFRLSAPVLFLNRDVMCSAGIDPATPIRSWQEVVANGTRISRALPGKIGLFFDYAADGNWLFLTLLNLQGAHLVSPQGALDFGGQAGMNALVLLRRIGEAGMVDLTRSQARQSFADGQIGQFVGSSSLYAMLHGRSRSASAIAAVPLPRWSAKPAVPFGGGMLMMTARDPAHQQLAWDFMRFATEPVAQRMLAESGTLSTAFDKDTARTGQLDAAGRKRIQDNPAIRAAVAQLPIATAWEGYPGSAGVKISNLVRDELQAVIVGQKSPVDAYRALLQIARLYVPSSTRT